MVVGLRLVHKSVNWALVGYETESRCGANCTLAVLASGLIYILAVGRHILLELPKIPMPEYPCLRSEAWGLCMGK